MPTLTVVFTTSRYSAKFLWFCDSLSNQDGVVDEIIAVDLHAELDGRKERWRQIAGRDFVHTNVKPTVWQGKHRLTKENWWAKSNALNTAICLCRTDWIAFVDDRSVLLPGWLNCVNDAITDNYAVFGTYEKRQHMIVENGVTKSSTALVNDKGERVGDDDRVRIVKEHRRGENPTACPWDWTYGCTLALPLEWALTVNGYDETCDGTSAEDTVFGAMLENNGYRMMYNRNMKIIEDRTPSDSLPLMIRKDKGVSPNNKSHAQLALLKNRQFALHQWNLGDIRQRVLRGEPWPVPNQPTHDWYDRQPLREM